MAGEKILSIDDSPTVQRLIDMILSSQGYEVVQASDGEEGIIKARAENPAVILVDFVMPKMNGFQVCKTLKDDPAFQDTPIILVTSKGDKVGTKFVDVLGITEYFTKPFQPEELLAKIREVIDRKGGGTAYSPPPRPAAPPAPEPESSLSGMEARIQDVVGRTLEGFVKNALPDMIRRELTKSQPVGNAGIKGNLANFRIIEVMQMLGLQRQSGKLVITKGSENGEIYFLDGDIVFASSSGNGGASPFETLLRRSCRLKDDQVARALSIVQKSSGPIDSALAREKLIDAKAFAECLKSHTEREVYKAMAWREGDFFFEKSAPPSFANPVRLKVDDLLLEGARRSDEWMLIQQKIPDFNVLFEPLIADAVELTKRGLSDVDTAVFAHVDGKRSVQNIIDASGLGEFEVAKSLFILLSVNLIRVRK